MGLSQVLQLLQNKVHPSARGGVPITPVVKTMNREASGVEDVGDILPHMVDTQAMPMTDPVRTVMPMVTRNAPTLNNSGSQELMRQAQAILAGLGNDPRPQIKAPNNESIALALLPALLGAGTSYISKLGQGYMQGQNQELALLEQERRRREQNIVRQAQSVQGQSDDMAARENLLFSQDNQNYRNDQDNDRMRWNTETVQDALDRRFGQANQTKLDIAGDKLELDGKKLDLAKDKFSYMKLSDADKMKFNREKLGWDRSKFSQNIAFQRQKMAQDMNKFNQSLAETKRYHDIFARVGGIRAAIGVNDSARGAFNSMVTMLGEKSDQLKEVNDEIASLHKNMLDYALSDAEKKETLTRIKELEPIRAQLTKDYADMEKNINESSGSVQSALEGKLSGFSFFDPGTPPSLGGAGGNGMPDPRIDRPNPTPKNPPPGGKPPPNPPSKVNIGGNNFKKTK